MSLLSNISLEVLMTKNIMNCHYTPVFVVVEIGIYSLKPIKPGGGGLRGPDAKNQGYHQPIEMKLCMSLSKKNIYPPPPPKNGFNIKIMSRFVLFNPKLTPMSISTVFKQRKFFFIFNILETSQ